MNKLYSVIVLALMVASVSSMPSSFGVNELQAHVSMNSAVEVGAFQQSHTDKCTGRRWPPAFRRCRCAMQVESVTQLRCTSPFPTRPPGDAFSP